MTDLDLENENLNKLIETNITEINRLGFANKMYLNLKETCQILNISVPTDKFFKASEVKLDYVVLGKRKLYSKRDIAEYLACNTVKVEKEV